MRILITGGTGLIGRRLCVALTALGHDLTVLSRQPMSVKEKCGPAVTALASLTDWTSEQSFDAIINLAGEPIVDARWTEKRKRKLLASRIGLTEQLVAKIAQARYKPAVMLSGSAVGYYGDSGERELDETASAGQDFSAELCAAWEAAASQIISNGTRLCLLRTGLVLDAEGGILHKMLLPFKLALGARLGDGRQWMSWIHIDDYVAVVLMLLLREDASGVYNMTAPQPVNNAEFTQRLAAALHRPALFVAPAWALRLAMGEMALLLLGGQRVYPRSLLALGYTFRYPTLALALNSLLKH
ncbi:MAG: TIGR01777 family oxidoreductase [Undibacterium sp.]|uniref:TIGR01777 family oxidoreductase n=1 Tax=Undibacterium sp. TaxID=1914977 RepID=UPI002718D374|nr:TIGR01777 family oxidoreductase [Undibacterium sp.]MDO8650985.1 TIGR01777 family oxidoreductase [Undibacterium sp.]